MRTRTLMLLALVAGVLACGGPAAETGYVAWSRHDSVAGTGQILSVVAGGPGFVAGGRDGDSAAFWTSADGLAWRPVEVERFSAPVAEIVADGPGFVAVTSSPASVWTSTDGSSWTRTADQPDLADATLLDLASNGDVLVAVGGGGYWLSDDGRSWRRTTVPGRAGNQHDLIAGGPGFVMVGSELVSSMEPKGAIWTSVDGSIWERLPDDPVFDGAELLSIARDGDGLLAAGWRIDEASGWFFSPAIWRSGDGTTWTRATIEDRTMAKPSPQPSGPGALEGALVTHASRGEAGWIAVGGDSRFNGTESDQRIALWTSADGSAWQRQEGITDPGLGTSSTLSFGATTSVISGDRALIFIARETGTSVWVSPPEGAEP